MKEGYSRVCVEVEKRRYGRHIRVTGDISEERKREIKYSIFSKINEDNYKKFLSILPKED